MPDQTGWSQNGGVFKEAQDINNNKTMIGKEFYSILWYLKGDIVHNPSSISGVPFVSCFLYFTTLLSSLTRFQTVWLLPSYSFLPQSFIAEI